MRQGSAEYLNVKTLRTLLPRVLVLFGFLAGTFALRDSSPPDYAIIAPAAYDAVLMEEVSVEQQAREAGLIVYGTISDVEPRRTGNGYVTDVTLEVDGALRGNAGATVKFTLQGGAVGNAGLAVGGVPNFLTGEKVLLFFDSASNKQILRLWQGKLTLAGNEALQAEEKRRIPLTTLEDRLAAALNKPVDLPNDGPSASSQPFVTSDPCPPWQLADLPVVFDVNPASPGTGGPTGTDYARLAYQSWHAWQALNDSYPAFSFGVITSRGQAVDWLNTVGWGNLSSGVLGVNHCAWSGDERIDSDTLIDRDSFTWDADDSNGISSTAYSLQAVMEHELGHGLSLGHSNMTCNGSASTPLMCPAVSNGTRKIILADDRAGAAFMYPLSGAAPGAPSGLAVTGSGASRTLNWNASSGTKHAYDIERSSTGCSGTFKSINTVAGNVTTFVDNDYGDGLGSGTWCYRVKALGTGGDSGWSNTSSGAAPTSTPTPTNTPSPTPTNTPTPTATPSPTATATPIPNVPDTVSVSPTNPSVDTNTATNISATFTHGGGYQALSRGDLVIASSYNEPTNRCWVLYRIDISRLYLIGDTGHYLAAGAPGAGFPVQNSRCTLYPAASSVSTNGDNVTVVFNVSFKDAFVGGPYNQFLRAQENTTWIWSSPNDHGNLTIVDGPGLPETIGVTPSNPTVDSNSPIELTATFSHGDGYDALSRGDLVIANSYSQGLDGCWLVYRVDINRLYLISDGGSYVAAGTPGTGSPVENSRCTLYPATSSVSTSGDNVTVTFRVAFKDAFVGGPYNQFLRAQENTSWIWSSPNDHGNLTVEEGPGLPGTVNTSPADITATAGVATNITATFSHGDGYDGLSRGDLVIANSYSQGLNGCWLVYRVDINRLYLISDGGSYIAAGTPGSGATVQNSRCILDAAASAVSANGDNVSVTFNVTFKQAFAGGPYNMWLRAQENLSWIWSAATDHGNVTVE